MAFLSVAICKTCGCDADTRTRGCSTCTKRHWMRSDKARAQRPRWNRAHYERHRDQINESNIRKGVN